MLRGDGSYEVDAPKANCMATRFEPDIVRCKNCGKVDNLHRPDGTCVESMQDTNFTERFKPIPVPECSCGHTGLLDMQWHLCDCHKKIAYEHNCMVTHGYYKQGFADGIDARKADYPRDNRLHAPFEKSAREEYINPVHRQDCQLRYITAEQVKKDDWGCTCGADRG